MSNTRNLTLKSEVLPLDYAELSDRPELAAQLERCELRSMSFSRDIVDAWLGMAGEFRKAKEALAKASRDSMWARWVARFNGAISIETANRLAEIGQLQADELQVLRSTIFANSGGIAGIAAYLAAPVEVQEQVQRGEVNPQLHAIQAATRALEEAKEAQRRAEEAERLVGELREKAARETDIKVQDAIARTRRETEDAIARATREAIDAKHEADRRKAEMELAQQTLRGAQQEWEARLARATAEQRQQVQREMEAELAKRTKAFEEERKRLEAKQKEAQRLAAQKEAEARELREHMENARDAVTVRARWDSTAVALIDTLDAAINKLPTQRDAQYFEEHERTLVESVRRRALSLAERMSELSRSMTVVEAR